MNKLIRKFSITALVSMVMFVSSFAQVFAEDIEIYNRTQTVPNVLFIIDTSASMSTMAGSKTRMQHVKDAMAAVLNDTYTTLNVGVMNLGYWNGSGPDFPIVDINANAQSLESTVASSTETVGQFLTRLSGAYQERGNTPTVDTYYEAMRYFRGDTVHRGKYRPGPWVDSRSWYANDQLSPKNAPAYPEPGPSPQADSYHRSAANPLTYTGGSYDPNVVRSGSSCWTAPFGAGNPPTFTQCVPANVYQPTPYTSTCSRVNEVPAGTTNSCPGGYTRDCLIYSESGTNVPANANDECASWGPYYCVGGTVTVPTAAEQGYYRCNHKKYGQFNSSPRYVSPINTACTENFVIMLTDGAPSINYSDDDAASIIYGSSNTSNCMDLSAEGISNPAVLDHGLCGTDIAKFMAENDQNSTIAGSQTIKTYTVGIQLPSGSDTRTYLEAIAREGQGSYIDANDPASLVSDLQSVVGSIVSKPRTISQAALSLDVESLTGNRSEVYLTMFADDFNQPRWQGNVKGFTFDPVNFLQGLDGNAVFDSTGDFSSSSRSYWTLSADGGTVDAGGVANVISHSLRNAHTDNGLTGSSINLAPLNSSNFDHNDITLFGLTSAGSNSADDALVDDLVNWARGQDVFDEDGDSSTVERHFVGDILHSTPVIAQYDTSSTPDGTVDKRVMFMMTNEGYLHAFDVTSNTSASELFAFMPRALLPNLDTLQRNVGGTSKVYGLDGNLVLHQDNGITDLTGTKTLYFGMRRGGNNYYSMDVTDPANPVLNWVIEGGSTGFEELGQTWSQPTVTKIKTSTGSKSVLVFGGGYDTNKDSNYTADSVGRAIYIVDATTGAKIFSAGPDNAIPGITYDVNIPIQDSIVADILDIDFDNDGIVDRLYAADTGGHIWRIDIDASTFFDATPSVGANAYSGYMFAELHGTGTANERRFYARPDAAITSGGKLAIVVGTGFRAHPLSNGVQDRLYMIVDPNGSKTNIPATAPSAITESSLVNNTTFLTLETDGDTTNNITPPFNYTSAGWYYDLVTDEKMFNSPIVVNGTAFFSSYIPPSNTCSSIPDGSRLLAISLDGKPSIDLDSDGTLDLSIYLTTHGFAAAPQLYSGPPITTSPPPPACVTDPTLPQCTCEAYPTLAKCSNESKTCEGSNLELMAGANNRVTLPLERCIQEEFWTSKPN